MTIMIELKASGMPIASKQTIIIASTILKMQSGGLQSLPGYHRKSSMATIPMPRAVTNLHRQLQTDIKCLHIQILSDQKERA